MVRYLIIACALAACGDNQPAPDAPPEGHIELHLEGDPGKPRVLVYTFENFWRHASNLDCRGTIVNMHFTRGYTVSTTNDPLAINAKNLAEHDVLVFAITSGDGLSAHAREDLEAWIRGGGGVVGFHSATMTEPSWPFYAREITGTRFAGHPDGLFPATVRMMPKAHPITAGLPDLALTDEWYFFTQRPELIPGAEVLMNLDEDTLPAAYPAINKQGFHAIAWARENLGARSFYAAFGHAPETWANPTMVELTARAIEWTARER